MRGQWSRYSVEVLKRCSGSRFNGSTLQPFNVPSRLGVAREMNFHALRQQTLATALTAPGKRGATAFRAHARAKTVLIFSSALRALKSAFHTVGR